MMNDKLAIRRKGIEKEEVVVKVQWLMWNLVIEDLIEDLIISKKKIYMRM